MKKILALALALMMIMAATAACADGVTLTFFDKNSGTRTFDDPVALELMERKNHDYDEAWRSMRVSSYTDFILTKLQRIKEIEDLDGKTLVSEGVEGNYMDIINYAVFGAIKLGY